MVIISLAIAFAFVFPSYFFDYKNDTNRRLGDFVKALKQLEADDYRAAMADTYGGKTPQETLLMYIQAIEKGDYVLASKYFIGQKQEEELEGFQKPATEEDKRRYIKILSSLHEDGYNNDKERFNMRANLDGPDFFASFKKYPNGIWKIIEI